ncbi:MAG: ABC-type uncharacterized transport system permease subunit [Gammaproteobacteria bacterium]|jgi:ABC-type uncharacterized transport system permease subunit
MMMFPTIVSALTLVLYCLSAFLIISQLARSPSIPLRQRWIALVPALIALLIHAIVLNHLIYQPNGLDLGFFTAFSLITWLISIQILLSCIFRRIETLGIVIFPMAGLASLLSSVDSSVPEQLIVVSNNSVQGHIMISVVAYSLIMLSAFQALLLDYQDRSIRSHNPGGFIRFLPPIHDMETLLFQFLGFGFICLSGSLISGFFFLEDIFAQHQAHKTVLSIVAWFILGILLFGRFQFGWRGKTAVRWTLSTFALLLIGFFGSKLVYEFIL